MTVRDMKQRSVSAHDFAMVPRADIPRSSFRIDKMLKTAFGGGMLIPIFIEEVLPGDTFNIRATIVCRTAVPITPILDNWHIDVHYFFIPNRLLWNNWVKFMGEQNNPGDSISYTIPQVVSAAGGFLVNSIYDYAGLPTVGQVLPGNTISANCMPFRAYLLTWNTWYRDENLQNSQNLNLGDGPEVVAAFGLLPRGKRPDYFTKALPFTQKGTSVQVPLGSTAPIRTATTETFTGANPSGGTIGTTFRRSATGAAPTNGLIGLNAGALTENAAAAGAWNNIVYPTNLYADLSTATAATINQIRQSFQIQKLLERDARGGTRYTEIVRAHFGVISPDARLQRPEFLGGGHTPVMINAIPQTSATGLTGGTTPAGTLAATGHAQGSNGFTYASTEHGYILGLASARADLTYQQGMRRMWSRSTRYDFYFPAFAMLGEQPIYNREIYADGSANDALTFGYQERWAEYRYNPSQITGIFKSTSAGTIDYWHSAEKFTSLPALNDTFVRDPTATVIQRNLAGGAATANQQFLCDIHFGGVLTRPMPMYSVPGLVDHF